MNDFDANHLDQTLRNLARAERPDVSALVQDHVAAMTRAGESAQLSPARTVVASGRSRSFWRLSSRVMVVGATMAVFVSSASAAYLGALPSRAQDAAAEVARSVGVHIPHGTTVKKVAHDPTLSGRDKGKAVSAVASTRGAEASTAKSGNGRGHRSDRADAAAPKGNASGRARKAADASTAKPAPPRAASARSSNARSDSNHGGRQDTPRAAKTRTPAEPAVTSVPAVSTSSHGRSATKAGPGEKAPIARTRGSRGHNS